MKYFIIRTAPDGIRYRLNKCHNDYWIKDFTQCWQFSEQGAKKICDRENKRVKETCERQGVKATTHYNYVEVDKTYEMYIPATMRINGIIHRRIIAPDETEIALDISLDSEREVMIPDDSSYMVFVNVKNNVPGKIEEIALGSEENISLLTATDRADCRKYVENTYIGKENDFCLIN